MGHRSQPDCPWDLRYRIVTGPCTAILSVVKHFRFVPFFALTAVPLACSVYNDDLLAGATGGDGDGAGIGGTPGDGDGDGDIITSGGGTGSGDGDGDTGGGSGGGGTGGEPGDGDGDTGGDPPLGGAPPVGGGGSTGGNPSGGGPSGGAPSWTGSCPDYEGPETLDLVDDMRTGGNAILTRNGRKGTYLAFHGTAMSMSPEPAASGLWPTDPLPMSAVPGTGGGDYALHLQTFELAVDPANNWQQFGFLLDEGNPVDISGYTGVMFCARREATIPQFMDLRVVEGDQDPDNDIEHDTTGDDGITPTWSYVKFPFDAATWTADSPTALTNAKSISFLLGNGVEYDVWIDNIYLYTE